jgi:predicted nucleic acid-binding protein
MIVLDTDVFSELMEKNPSPNVRAWLNRQDLREIHITTLTLYEVQYGIEQLPQSRKRAALEDALFQTMIWPLEHRILPFIEQAAYLAAAMTAARREAGRPIALADVQIAGIAAANSATLATGNTRDFAGLAIEIVSPWEVG